ncbi:MULTISPECIES: DNA polymerase III subunit beta [unclassified Shinella]|uniref:DNA polymerase III subunit beta n=1 Tax=unclassified Shinella TaxID=2643062 RepID=UPI00234E7F40|nr:MULTISPECIES: DNA polymerase III subunit beta [unclassified Shinella]MCO5153351.1 DNA polymerase III subunit beta [Shinella sp.]MDC7260530.1 DNA polymerase III subunit beta [Shinella sp. HY16]MDC7267425.1 DNA polymerase III subunit beta [Shinella sp. YZ44]
MAETWFTIHRSSLLPALSRVADAMDTKTKIPILAHVLLQPDGETLRLRCTNLDLQIDAECEMMEPASFASVALPVSRLSAILKEMPESAEISFGAGRLGDQVGIRSGRSSFSVPYLPGRDFPEMGTRLSGGWIEIDGSKLADALKKAAYAVNKADDRPYLCGFCLHETKAGGGIVVAATDGHYLVQIEVPGVSNVGFPPVENSYPHIILPPMGADPIRKLLDGAKQGARLAVSAEKIAVAYDGVEIQSKLIAATYPGYDRLIPARTDQTIVIAREVLASSVRRVGAMTDDAKNDGIRLKVVDDRLQIDMLTEKGGFASDVVQGAISAPNGFIVAHSAPRLEKTLSNIQSVDIEISLTDAATAVVMRPLDGSPELYLLTAMRPRFTAE